MVVITQNLGRSEAPAHFFRTALTHPPHPPQVKEQAGRTLTLPSGTDADSVLADACALANFRGRRSAQQKKSRRRGEKPKQGKLSAGLGLLYDRFNSVQGMSGSFCCA